MVPYPLMLSTFSHQFTLWFNVHLEFGLQNDFTLRACTCSMYNTNEMSTGALPLPTTEATQRRFFQKKSRAEFYSGCQLKKYQSPA